jgi:biopolymer transport protein ExbD
MTALAAHRRATHAPAAEPNVIPFIDVLLVLLIIFMVTAPKPTVDLRLDMLRPHGPVAVTIPPTAVSITAADGGVRIFVNEEPTSLEALAARVLARVLAVDPSLTGDDAHAEARIFVRADQDVAYAHVVAAVDALQFAGFAKVAVVAQSEAP